MKPTTWQAKIPLHSLWIPSALILIGGFVSSINAVNPPSSLSVTLRSWFVLTLWISMSMVMVRRGHATAIIVTLVGAGCFTSLIAVLDQFLGWHLGDLISGNKVTFWNRQIGTFGHPNDLGFFTFVTLVLALGLLLHERQTRQRFWVTLFLGIGSLLITFALFLSGAVTGWVSTLLALGILLFILVRRAGRWAQLGVVSTALLLAMAFLLLMTQESFAGTINSLLEFNLDRATGLTGPGRLELLVNAFGVIDESPWVGLGMDQSATGRLGVEDLVTHGIVHNTIISGWLSGGLLVFVGLMMVYVIAVVTAVRAIAYGSTYKDWLVVSLGAVVLGFIVFDQTQPHLTQRFTWLMLGLLFGMGFGIKVFSFRRNTPRVGSG